MIRHFLKTTLRIFYRRKMYSLISLSGLILAFTVSFLILIYAINELQVNREFVNNERIYRVVNHVKSTSSTWAVTAKDLGPQIKASMPELKGVSRMARFGKAIKVIQNDQEIGTQPMFVDNDFFGMFENETGINSLLNFDDPYSIIITKNLAEKIPHENTLVGKTIELKVFDKEVNARVSIVIDGFTDKSNIQANLFMCMDLFDKTNDAAIFDWHPFFHTFIMVPSNTNMESTQASFDALDRDHFDDTKISTFELQPFSDFYLDSNGLANHNYTSGDKNKIQLFLTVASLLLLIAIVNYTILATANALYRQKEFGIRKSFGSSRKNLLLQTLSESMSMALIALPISIILTELLLPYANLFWEKELDFHVLGNWQIALIFFILSIITGLISGSYLSFYISKLKPTLILSPLSSKRSGISVRKSLIVIQIFIFVILSSFSVLVLKQMDYFQSKSMGYDPENLLAYDFVLKDTENNNFTNSTRIKGCLDEINSNPDIVLASFFFNPMPPFRDNTGFQSVYTKDNPEEAKTFLTLSGDHNVGKIMGLNLLKGSHLREGVYDKVLLTETGVKHLGLKNPIGEIIGAGGEYEIIGMVEDFHAQSFRREIAPMLIRAHDLEKFNDYFFRVNFGIRYKSGKEKQVVTYLNQKTKEYFPTYEVEDRAFQIDRIKEIYKNEKKVAQTVIMGVVIVVFISTMGLFALSLYESERRLKEIAIRKINGASTVNIVLLLSKEFTIWVIIAFVLAIPISYFFMNKWLENFIFQTLISWWIFPLIGVITLIIAWGTISIQSIRAARMNPVNSLKND